MRKCGVVAGDRVVGYIPNCPEAIEAMAATATIGNNSKSMRLKMKICMR